MKIHCADLFKQFDTEELVKKFDTLEYKVGLFEKRTITLWQVDDSFADGTIENPVYRAKAIDENGNLYYVTWEQYKTDTENECFINENGECMGDWSDGSNACNWDKYTVERM